MTHTQCYGQMFPSVVEPVTGRTDWGKAFGVEMHRAGGMAITTRAVGVDPAAWDECVQCEAFDHCYKLSMAKLALEGSISQFAY